MLLKDLREVLDTVKEGLRTKKIHFRTYAKVIPYLSSHWIIILFSSIGVVVVALLSIPGPLIVRRVIDNVLPELDLSGLAIAVVILVVIQVLNFFLSFFMNYSFIKLSQTILSTIKRSLFAKILKLPCSFYDKTQTGYLVSRLNEINTLGPLFSSSLIRLLILIVECGFCLLCMYLINWKISLLATFALPMIYLIAKAGAAGMQAATEQVLEKSAVAAMKIQESLTGVEIVKVLGREQDEIDILNMKIQASAQSNINQSVILTFFTELSLLIASVAGFIVLFVSGKLIMDGQITLGTYFALSGFAGKVYGNLNLIISLGMSFRSIGVAIERIHYFDTLVSEQVDEKRIKKLGRLKGEIEFNNVSFSYCEGISVFKDLSLKIEQGEKVLVCGESGSGKTTLFKLLLGMYKPQEGKIFWDGVDLEEIGLSSLREKVSVVTQNTFLFNDTILNNILFGRPGSSISDVKEAAGKAGAHEFIMNLEKGYETIVGERGMRLSGGQVQRIAIARAIIRNSTVILFDEATAHLDTENTSIIRETISKIGKDKTCLVIAHRLDTTWNGYFDRMITIKECNYSSEKLLA